MDGWMDVWMDGGVGEWMHVDQEKRIGLKLSPIFMIK
jgi:hypothetical protein